MWVRRKTIQWPVAVEVDNAALTVLTSESYLGGTWEVRVFYDDNGNAQNSEIYAEYSPDLATWYEEQGYSISVTAGERWTAYVVGGFTGRITAQKAVGAENAVVGIFDEKQNIMYREIDLDDDTVSVETDPGTIMWASGDDTKECDAVMVFIDDNGNAQNLEISVWMAPESPGDAAPTWHVAVPATTIHTAKDRRAAILVRHTMGQMIKVLGVKAVEAEDVGIIVKGRLPYFRQWVI